MTTNDKEIKFVKLVSVYDNFNILAIKGILKDANIPFQESSDSANEYFRQILGSQLIGTDILVPEDSLQKARELVNMVLGVDFRGYEQEEKDNMNK
ncbi:Hypothetical protein ING2D1G_0841 [Peptoniphilus sp. ING2-D1G]|nr:Hypothetical protein ING2D1G_0841 [Peptoniphilus sp. ING2-D1G]